MDRDTAYKQEIIWAEAQSDYEIKPLSWWESIYDYPGERETAVLDLVAYGEYEDLDGNLTRTEDRAGLREAAKVLWGIDAPEPPADESE